MHFVKFFCLLLLELFITMLQAASPAAFTDGFEPDQTSGRILISFSSGKNITARKLSFTGRGEYRGRRALKCEYGFSGKGWIVYNLKYALPGNVHPSDLQRGDHISFHVKGEPTGVYVNLQLVDNKGEFFQRNFKLSENRWQQKKVSLEAENFSNVWNGDRKLDFPLKQVNLTVNMDEKGKGVFYLDELTLRGKKLTRRPMMPDRTDEALKLKDRRVYDKPLTDKKHIIAHHMSEIMGRGSPEPAFYKREHYDTNGSTKSLGGYIQYLPYIDYRPGSPGGVKSMARVAALELKAAMACGLTGFQFYFPFGSEAMMDDYCNRIQILMKQAEAMQADFTFTLCFANADHNLPEKKKISRWSSKVKDLLDNTPASYWLRTPDGRHIFYTWMADGLAEEIDSAWSVSQNAAKIKYAALAYNNLSQAIGVEAAWVYLVLNLGADTDPAYQQEILSYFPAVWGWAQLDYRYHKDNIWDRFAALARENNRTYTQTATLDFYSSKSFPKENKWQLIFDIDKALKLGPEKQYKHYMELELTKAFRQTLARGIKMEQGIINITTWNDFAEGHHLSPSANHNFAFAMILDYYKNKWFKADYVPQQEKAAVFFKKYRSDLKPQYDFELFHEGLEPPSAADYIEVVTILKEKAQVFINGKEAGPVMAGLDAVRIPAEAGEVSFQVRRAGAVVLELTATEWITDSPYRTDRLTYGYSTVEEKYIQKIFGDNRRTILPSRQYTGKE